MSPSPIATVSPPPVQISCRPDYAPPDPDRPQVQLAFTVGRDHRTVTGHERVVFRPDLPVTELVFRLWPNGRDHLLGGTLTVAKGSIDGRAVRLQAESAGGRPSTQGTLLSLPLGRVVPAGTAVVADLDFTLVLPNATIDRVGSDGQLAWWGTAAPLLSWQRGVGWSRTPGSSALAEMAVSEAAQTDITVVAPAADTVLANGVGEPPTRASATTRRWHFTNPTARDVVVAVGPLQITETRIATPSGTVPVRIATAPGTASSSQEIAADLQRALPLAVTAFGRFPFPVLNVAILPSLAGSGIEYPGMFLIGSGTGQSIVTHELVHMWFYGMVGDDQELHPWLDEAFATYGEQLIDAAMLGVQPQLTDPLGYSALPVDSPVTAFEQDYYGYDEVVYYKGAAALQRARQDSGAGNFDAAMRCYVRANAWGIATPTDVLRALAPLPAAVGVLRQAGALR